MCQLDWALLSAFITALAAIANAFLLLWMIRVTIRYVNGTLSLLEVSRGSLRELQKQYLAVIERENRPYTNLLDRTIRNLELLSKRDLVYAFENRDGSGWLSEDDLLPSDYPTLVQQAMAFNAELYEALEIAKTKLLLRPRQIVFEMNNLGSSGKSTLPELPKLQAEFRSELLPIISLLKSTHTQLAKAFKPPEHSYLDSNETTEKESIKGPTHR
jgi:hypothetical protein